MVSKESKRFRAVVRLGVLGVVMVITFSRCANIGSPTGGPKDTIPPMVLRITPEYGTTNFKEKQIVIDFDEYIQLKDQSKEFFASPKMKSKPTLTIKGRSLEITYSDTLAENQTYSFNFGDAVVDNNEGNALRGFRYVFSTGASIDSLISSGYTVDAYSKDSVSKAYIFFFEAESDSIPELDSTIFNHPPAVIARAFSNGIFLAENLKPIDYRIYAFEDKNGNMAYEPGVDKIGFLDGVHNPVNMPEFGARFDTTRGHIVPDPQLYFRMFMDKGFKRQMLGKLQRPTQHMAIISFAAVEPEIESIILEGIDSSQIIVEYLRPAYDSIALWLNVPKVELPDTIRGEITYLKHDSLNMLVSITEPLVFSWQPPKEKKERRGLFGRRGEDQSEDTTAPVVEEMTSDSTLLIADTDEAVKNEAKVVQAKKKIPWWRRWWPFGRKKDKRTTTQTDTAGGDAESEEEKEGEEKEINPFTYKMELAKDLNPLNNIPITFDMPLTRLDTAAISIIRVVSDEQKHRVRFTVEQDSVELRKYYIKAPWTSNQNYELMIPSGAFINVASESNDTIKNSFSVLSPDKFATLNLNIKGKTPDSEYIIELMNKDKVIQKKSGLKEGLHVFQYVELGEIRIRVVEDDNCNGEWEVGNMVNRIQPERVEFFTNKNGLETFETKQNFELEFDLDMNEVFAPITMERIILQLQKLEEARLIRLEQDAAKKAREPKQQSSSSSTGGMGSGMGGGFGGNLPR